MGLILLIISGLLLVATLPSWPFSKGWGYYPAAAAVLLVIIVILLIATGWL